MRSTVRRATMTVDLRVRSVCGYVTVAKACSVENVSTNAYRVRVPYVRRVVTHVMIAERRAYDIMCRIVSLIERD